MAKISDLLPVGDIVLPRRSLDPDQAEQYVGGPKLLNTYRKAGWLAPYVQGNRLTRYDLRDLDVCIDRHKREQP